VIITKGINCSEGNTLTITGTGQLTITTPGDTNAGIGGNDGEDGGEITIEGGKIIAQGGAGAAGIGGGSGKDGGTINIKGGEISATGASSGAGIGGGYYGNGGTIKISDGKITATGGHSAAGIGGGFSGTGGEITISDGEISATGTYGGAGIGGGRGSVEKYSDGGTIIIEGGIIESAQGGSQAAGIGGGYRGTGGNITILDGDISAVGGQYGAGIGGGLKLGNFGGDGGTINIEGGEITAEGGERGAGIGGGQGGDGSSEDGAITISDGEITATGGELGAGIGGGYEGDGGTITISDKALIKEANGGEYGSENGSGAGIGGGQLGNGGTINIEGGTITKAQGGFKGAGIGGGYEGNGGIISISSGTIELAQGGEYGAGIGGGRRGPAGQEINISGDAKITEAIGGDFAAGIGGGEGGDGGIINIEGGDITAIGGDEDGGAGIGTGYNVTNGEPEITISGGEISATGGNNAAGIGGGEFGAGGKIEISGGTISATGSAGGAGIGSGFARDGDTIKIKGGTISAEGGSAGGAGIGGGKKDFEFGGDGGQITIEGGTISAAGGTSAAGIGVGSGGTTGTTIITGGSINATSINPLPKAADGESSVYLNTLTVPVEFEEALVTKYYESNYGIDDVYTDSDATLYFYLPATLSAELIALSFDEELDGTEDYYGKSYTRSTSAIEQYLPYLQLATPEAEIDFIYELLTGLIPETAYDISVPLEQFSLKPLSSTLADDSGIIEIDESWIGSDINITLRTTGVPYGDSEAQVLSIPPRPEATAPLKQLVKTAPKSEGDKGKVSGLKVGMEYSTDPNAAPGSWTTVTSTDDLDLPPGTYYFREIADGEHFATEYVTVVIPSFLAPVAPDSSAEPLGLAGTGVNLDLAYLLVVLLLAFGTLLKKRVILAPDNCELARPGI
jgi:hypothetical protein